MSLTITNNNTCSSLEPYALYGDSRYVTETGNLYAYREPGKNEIEKKGGEMRAIYTTYVVDPKTERVLAKIQTIAGADKEQAAQMKALTSKEFLELGITEIDDYDITTDRETNGFIRAKETVKRVKVVKG